jgi:hypothetical protein
MGHAGQALKARIDEVSWFSKVAAAVDLTESQSRGENSRLKKMSVVIRLRMRSEAIGGDSVY